MSAAQQLKPYHFQPGQSGNPGGKAKQPLKRVDAMLAELGKHPITELLALLPDLRTREQAEVWMTILSYTHAKPKETAPDPADAEREEIRKLTNAQLAALAETMIPKLKAT